VRFEFRGDIRAGLAGAHDACIGAGAKRECQGVDQDRFAGACFARENREAAVEFKVERGDDDEVAYREVAKHGGRLVAWVTGCGQVLRVSSGSAQCSFRIQDSGSVQGLMSSSCDGYSFQCSFLRNVA
jgi:hypothetical protein